MITSPPVVSGLWEPVRNEVGEAGLRLHLHKGQRRVWQSERRFPLMMAGSQSGKTSFGPLWLHREIEQKGEGDYLVVTPTFPLLKLKALPEFRRLFEHTLHLGEWHAADHVFQYHDGETRVIFGSATNPESLESATAKAAWLDECGQDTFRLESWEAIQRRLALAQGRALGTTTPYNLGWLKQQWVDRFQAGDPDYDVIRFSSVANPVFPREEYERAKRTLPSWKFDMFYDGIMTRPAGLIYADFQDRYREEGGQLVRPFQIPTHWARYGGIDPGIVNTARVLVAEDPVSHVYYLYDEYHGGGTTAEEQVASAKTATEGVNMVAWWLGAKSETHYRADYARYGLYAQEPPVPDVEVGIDHVTALWKTRRLYVFDTCRGLRDELGTYHRVLDERGEATMQIADKEIFHRLDALRYLALGLTAGLIPGNWDEDDGAATSEPLVKWGSWS